jgi:hypothetical protein
MKRENPQLLLGNHQTIYFGKINFFLILNQLIKNDCTAYFIYENNPAQENMETAADIPHIEVMSKLCSIQETSTGIQLNLKDNEYIKVDANICVIEVISKDLITGYRVRMDCSFDQNPDEHYVTFSFGDFRIHISQVDEKRFSSVVSSLPELKRKHEEEGLDEFHELDSANSSMDRSFWENIDNMMED